MTGWSVITSCAQSLTVSIHSRPVSEKIMNPAAPAREASTTQNHGERHSLRRDDFIAPEA